MIEMRSADDGSDTLMLVIGSRMIEEETLRLRTIEKARRMWWSGRIGR